MIIKSAELETVCGITSTLPETEMPEIAFAGKSNVGKSSLINGLLNRKSLARTSSQPGKTQTINYYNINHDLYFVDLPGYGYAQVSVEIRAKWGKMVERYLHTSKQLYDWIVKNGYEPVIIATKLDKIKRSQIQKNLKIIRQKIQPVEGTIIIPFSAQTKQGKEEILQLIEDRIAESEPEFE